MDKLKTNKEALELHRPFVVAGIYQKEKCWDADINAYLAAIDDALAAHEMKPEYDRMKAKIAEVMAMEEKDVTVWDEPMLKEIKAILGGE